MKLNLRDCSVNRYIWLLIIIFLFQCLIGCSPAIRKKFIRKEKKKEPEPVFVYQQKEYKPDPNPLRYKRHFVFWKVWQKELVDKLGKNRHYDLRIFDEILSNLEDMKNLLKPPKSEEMGKYIAILKGYKERYTEQNTSDIRIKQIRRELDRILLRIDKGFRYSRVADYIK